MSIWRRICWAVLGCAACWAQARAAEPGVGGRDPEPVGEESAGGRHWRLQTERGAVHVWRPQGYRPGTGGIAVYVHGYYTDVDAAWREHDLAGQFARSRQNALFIVPEAPVGDEQAVCFPDLEELLRTVFGRLPLRRPSGPLVVAGHSGAFRTFLTWLAHPKVQEILLLDGFYNNESEFATWLEGDARRRLLLLGVDTAERSQEFLKKYVFGVVRDELPEDFAQFSDAERRARLLLIRDRCGHMELVTQGQALPLALRLSHLALLPRR